MTTPPYPSGPPEQAPGTPGVSPAQPSGQPGAPGYGYPGYPVYRQTNGLAIASLVLGIIWFYWVGSILALIFGYVARKQIRERSEGGDGLAIAGIVLGWVGIGALAIVLVVLGIGFATGGA